MTSKLFGIFLFSFTALLFSLSLVGCGRAVYEEDDVVSINSESECRIIYGSHASDSVVRYAKKFGNLLREATGCSVIVESDWRIGGDTKTASSPSGGDVMILFGNTDLPDSAEAYNSLPEEGYLISGKDGRIVIAATSEKLLYTAAEKLISVYGTKSGTIDVQTSKPTVKQEYYFFKIADKESVFSDIVIDSNVPSGLKPLAEYSAELIQSKSQGVVGIVENEEFASSKRTQIFITISDDEKNDGTASLRYLGNRLYISGSDENSLKSALWTFISDYVLGCDYREDGTPLICFPKDTSVSYKWECPLPKIPGCTLSKTTETGNGDYYFEYSGANESIYSSYIKMMQKIGYLVGGANSREEYLSTSLSDGRRFVNLRYYPETSMLTLNIMLT